MASWTKKYVDYKKYYATRDQEEVNLTVKYEATVYKSQRNRMIRINWRRLLELME